MSSLQYLVVIEEGKSSYGAYVPDLPGCVTVGESRDEVVELIQEAIALHIQDLESPPVPKSFGVMIDVGGRQVTKAAGVCGGSACVAGTRIPVWVLAQAQQLGNSEAEILQNYSSLTAADLAIALAYAADHPEEIEKDIRENLEE